MLSNTPTLHRLPVQYDPVTRQQGPFTAPSMAKGQLERGPSQLGKRRGARRCPGCLQPCPAPQPRAEAGSHTEEEPVVM